MGRGFFWFFSLFWLVGFPVLDSLCRMAHSLVAILRVFLVYLVRKGRTTQGLTRHPTRPGQAIPQCFFQFAFLFLIETLRLLVTQDIGREVISYFGGLLHLLLPFSCLPGSNPIIGRARGQFLSVVGL